MASASVGSSTPCLRRETNTMSLVLGVDIGTTATKAVLVGLDGELHAERSAPARLDSPLPGFAEGDPNEWWHNTCELTQALLSDARVTREHVQAVGVSGMVPTVIALDAHHRPLGSSIQQNDSRATREIRDLAERFPDSLHLTGTALTAQSVGPKWLWLRRHRPEIVDAARHVTGSYGWITGRLTGEWVAETNWALESGLSAKGAHWVDEVLGMVGLDPAMLGPIRFPTDPVGTVTPDASDATGLAEGTPVAVGCADHVASACAAGLFDPGDLLFKLGGAADILIVSSDPVTDHRIYLDRHPLSDGWLPNGCMAASGSLLRWFQRELAGGESLAVLDAEAETVEPGSGGVVALPYVLGEKSPLNDPDLRGVIAGLHLGHTRAHVFRALLESIAFGFAHHLEVFGELGLELGVARITNGGSRSRLWRQIVADVCQTPVRSLEIAGGSALGAAAIAAEAAELRPARELLADSLSVSEVIEPDSASADIYGQRYREYRELTHSSRHVLHSLAREASQ